MQQTRALELYTYVRTYALASAPRLDKYTLAMSVTFTYDLAQIALT